MSEYKDIDIYCFHEIPIGEECWLIDETYLDEFDSALRKMLAGGDYPNVGSGNFVVARQKNENSIELSWYPNTHTRFHEVSINLPKEKFIKCIGCWEFSVIPHIFVKHEWLENLYVREYTIFALVDVIGIKEAMQNSYLSKQMLISLRDAIDALAKKNPNISFISFADSLLLKSNWSVGYFKKGIECNYEPEAFVRVVKELQTIYTRILGLKVCAILTQGNNEYYEESLLHISDSKNHISLNSLGIPFAELMAIENAVRAAIKSGSQVPSEVYMDAQFYHSLMFKLEFNKNAGNKNYYKAIMKNGESSYFYSDCDHLLANLR